ncbi:hypothetical protein HOY82DRAFT_612524 [Tuber indicum]|nr:hypothetical protein HOY82DRAFT_612524 [Tuber indicum]
MGGNSLEKNGFTESPNYATEIGMTPEQYHELKVYIKSIILPGTPAFGCTRLGDKESKKAYHQWFNNALEEIGPKIFPKGGKGLVWPEDYAGIYMAVHEVVQILRIGIGGGCGEGDDFEAVEGETKGCDEMEMAEDDGLSEGESADDTDLEEDDEIVDEQIAQDEQENQMMMGEDYRNRLAMEEGVETDTIGLLGLTKHEVFAHFPSLAEGCFDWDEVVGSISPESVRHLANLDQMRSII